MKTVFIICMIVSTGFANAKSCKRECRIEHSKCYEDLVENLTYKDIEGYNVSLAAAKKYYARGCKKQKLRCLDECERAAWRSQAYF